MTTARGRDATKQRRSKLQQAQLQNRMDRFLGCAVCGRGRPELEPHEPMERRTVSCWDVHVCQRHGKLGYAITFGKLRVFELPPP